MRKFILCCGITLYAFALNAQSMQHVDMLGETPLIIHTDINDSLFNLAFVHVHANELTALQTAKKFSLENKTSIICSILQKGTSASHFMIPFSNLIPTGCSPAPAGKIRYAHIP